MLQLQLLAPMLWHQRHLHLTWAAPGLEAARFAINSEIFGPLTTDEACYGMWPFNAWLNGRIFITSLNAFELPEKRIRFDCAETRDEVDLALLPLELRNFHLGPWVLVCRPTDEAFVWDREFKEGNEVIQVSKGHCVGGGLALLLWIYGNIRSCLEIAIKLIKPLLLPGNPFAAIEVYAWTKRNGLPFQADDITIIPMINTGIATEMAAIRDHAASMLFVTSSAIIRCKICAVAPVAFELRAMAKIKSI